MGFSFSATARCELCGEYLSSSDEECDHKGQKPVENMFRHVSWDKTVSVEACPGFHWHALKDMEGDDWIGYKWLGPKSQVKSMLNGVMWDDIDDLPHIQMSTDAPKEVEDYGN
jgi:hypothetical protein